MSDITGLTRGGEAYSPNFVLALDQTKCIGCGRCFKVCSRNVFMLVEREDGEDEFDDDDDDGFDDDTSMVMSLANALDCIGCEACSRVCPKNCMTHGYSPVVAAA
ncbi:MAG: ferredoxin III, nif-specific [Rhodocyclaceae bacterium]|nr:ferredoxin III, nif-specific [Rhodocyclaceae bacterium]